MRASPSSWHDVNFTARLPDHVKPDRVLVCEAAKELAVGRLKTVRFPHSQELQIRGLAGNVTADPARRPLERWTRLQLPDGQWLRTSSRCGAPGLR
jgi:hypothetical protein